MVKLAHKVLLCCASLFEQLIEGIARIIALFSLALAGLEQPIQVLTHVVALYRFAAAFGQRQAIIRLKVIAKIGLDFIAHIIGLGLAALVAFAGIEEPAVLAAMDVGLAVGAFITAHCLADQFHLTSTIVTNHKLFAGVYSLTNHRLSVMLP
jgi:hypothetical protein